MLALACACRGDARPAAPPMPLPVSALPPSPGDVRDPAVARLEAALRDSAARGDLAVLRAQLPPSLLFDDWLAAQPLDRAYAVALPVAIPLGPVGTLAMVEVTAHGGHVPERRYQQLVVVPLGAGAAGYLSADLIERLALPPRAISGEVLIDDRTRWIQADLIATFEIAARVPVLVRLPASDLRGAEVTQDGVRCRAWRHDKLLVFEPAATGTARVRIAYQGFLENGVQVSPFRWGGGVDLMEVSDLIGLVRGRPAQIDLVVHHRADAHLWSTLAGVERTGRFAGWRTLHLAGTTDALPLRLAGGGGPPRSETLNVPGAAITISARHEDDLARARAAFAIAADALAPLGSMPDRTLRVTVVPLGRNGEYANATIAFGLVGDPIVDAQHATHELTHGWFGGSVAPRSDRATRWWEAVATYTTSWIGGPDQARAVRAGWLARLQRLPRAHERPDLPPQAVGTATSAVLSYQRGALVLAGLEARVGRAAMVRWLRAFAEGRRGQVTDLEAMIATIGPALGAEHEAWTRRWFNATGPATIDLTDVAIEGGRLRGVLVVAAPAFDLRVALTFARGDRHLATEWVSVAGPRTPIELAVPDGATVIVLASDATLPLRSPRGIDGLRSLVIALTDAGLADVDDGAFRGHP